VAAAHRVARELINKHERLKMKTSECLARGEMAAAGFDDFRSAVLKIVAQHRRLGLENLRLRAFAERVTWSGGELAADAGELLASLGQPIRDPEAERLRGLLKRLYDRVWASDDGNCVVDFLRFEQPDGVSIHDVGPPEEDRERNEIEALLAEVQGAIAPLANEDPPTEVMEPPVDVAGDENCR
jgi:hypothetical protein